MDKATIFKIIQCADDESGWKRKPGSGRKAVKMNANKVEALKKLFVHQDDLSNRTASLKYGIFHPYAYKIIANKSIIKKKRRRRFQIDPNYRNKLQEPSVEVFTAILTRTIGLWMMIFISLILDQL